MFLRLAAAAVYVVILAVYVSIRPGPIPDAGLAGNSLSYHLHDDNLCSLHSW